MKPRNPATAPNKKARQLSLATGCRASGCAEGYAVFHSSPAESSASVSTAVHPSRLASASISVLLRSGLFSGSRIISSSPASMHCVIQSTSHPASERSDSSNCRQRSARAASSGLMLSDRFAVCVVCVGITISPRTLPPSFSEAEGMRAQGGTPTPVHPREGDHTRAYSLITLANSSPKTTGTKNLCKQTLKK